MYWVMCRCHTLSGGMGTPPLTGGVPDAARSARFMRAAERSGCGAGRRVGELAARTRGGSGSRRQEGRPVLEGTGPTDMERADGIPLGRV